MCRVRFTAPQPLPPPPFYAQDEGELQAALSAAGGGSFPRSLARLLIRVFDDNRNGGLDFDEFRSAHQGIKTLQDRLMRLHREHVSAGLSPDEAAPSEDQFFFTREELASFLEVYFAERGPAVRALAVESACWDDAADGVPRLRFPAALKLVVQLFGLQRASASEEEARRFFVLCG